MNSSASVAKVAKISAWIALAILLLLPFHAFLTVWMSSLFGHYTLLRLWKEFLLVLVLAGAVYILLSDKKLAKRFFSAWLTRLILIYVLVILAWGLVPLAKHDVSAKAAWYGILVNSRFLIFFLAVMVVSAKTGLLERNRLKILLAPAMLVAAFAILQFLVLPYDFLKHFGYGPNTIYPYETINHNINHIRVESTLRGANPLGAYLILPISVLAVMFFKEKRERLDKTMFGIGLLLALVFSFSRSAWIGATIAVLVVVWALITSYRAKRVALWIAAGLIALGGLAVITLRNNTEFQNVFLHTQHNSAVATTSNELHVSAAKTAARDIVHQPLGAGIGTAGPESVYNKQPARIAENYFLQIGQEAGVIGAMLFIAICIVIGKMLYGQRANPLALALLAALAGVSFVNLLSHAWTDDTLAYLWWGLAAIVLSPAILTDRRNHKNGKKLQAA